MCVHEPLHMCRGQRTTLRGHSFFPLWFQELNSDIQTCTASTVPPPDDLRHQLSKRNFNFSVKNERIESR